MKKIKKYSFWTGLSAAVIILFNALGKAFGFTIDNQIIEEVIMAVCGVLVALGIVCLPVKEEQEKSEKEEQTQGEKIEETKESAQTEIKNKEDNGLK